MAPKKQYKPRGTKTTKGPKTYGKTKVVTPTNGQQLVVVEAPGKVHKIQGYLGPQYVVMASVGHVMDLPKKGLGVDIDNNYDPTYEVMPGKEEVVDGLKEAAATAGAIFLAADPDREGEAIAYSVAMLLKRPGLPMYRVSYNAISKAAIQAAFQAPRNLDKNLVRAQQARRILDRLVGFKASPLLWNTVRRGLSAGRVQSVALRMIVDRQAEIDQFKPRDYWTIQASLKTAKGEPFTAEIKAEYDTQADADAVIAKLQSGQFVVKDVDSKVRSRAPFPPFTTSQMLQQAHAILGWNAKRTNSAAQQLYERGDVTYIRTDSVFIDPAAVTDIRTYLQLQGPRYLPAAPVVHTTKAANAQEAHEAIRPIDNNLAPANTVGQMPPDCQSLYELVWRRAIASQSTDAQFRQVLVAIENSGIDLQSKGQTLVFDGFLKFWTYSDSKEVQLPPLAVKDVLGVDKIEALKHTTKPPSRYNPGSIIKELEESGVGRPSTYQALLDTLIRRLYIEEDGKAFKATEVGKEVVKLLKQYAPRVVDTQFTADMELKLDEVAQGTLDWVKCIDIFWKPLEAEIAQATTIIGSQSVQTDKMCLKCGKPLMKKFNARGSFYVCSDKPCGSFFSIGDNELPVIRKAEEHATPCPLCQGRIIKRMVKATGKTFWGCANYETTGCRGSLDESGNARIPEVKVVIGPCPKCKTGQIVVKKSRWGKEFKACDQYPRCKTIVP
jgi:DNA topoisomerase-1